MVGRAAAFLVVVTVSRGIAADCNQNDVPDREDMESGTSADCNGNLVPDECDLRYENRWLRVDSSVFEDIDPRSLCFARLNEDYQSDAAAVPLGSSSVAVRLRLPDFDKVSFEEEIRYYEVPPSPGLLAAEDVDGDGVSDLIVADRAVPRISVLSGSGAGAFSSPRALPLGVIPAAFLVVDLDGGLGPEIVALRSAPAAISILWNRGLGALDEEVLHELPAPAASSRASALASGDLDGDGDMDLIAAGAEDAPARVLWNLGSLNFRSEGVSVRGESLAVLDLDSDDDMDIAASGPAAMRIYRNAGAGSFVLLGEFFAGKSPGEVTRGAGLELAVAGDRIGILATTDGIAYTPWRIAEVFGSTEETGPFASMASPDIGSSDRGRVLAAIGNETRNEAVVMTLITAYGTTSRDCNENDIPDECDIAAGAEADCDQDGWPDSCEPDCNGNGVQDQCDIDRLTSADCNRDRVPDECSPWHDDREDADRDGIVDHCDPDNPYELRFTGPTNLRLVDEVPNADFFVELGGPVGRRIEGFSYGVRSEDCTIVAATIAGTALSGLPLTLAGVRPGTESPDRTEPCIWAAAYDWRDPPLFDGGDAHVLLRLTLACPRIDGAACGSGTISFSPTCFHTGQAQCVLDLEGDESRWPLLTSRSFTICIPDFRRGDANADGKVDISDGVRTAMYLFLGAVAPPCLDAADATDDGALDISDAIRILMDFFIPQDTGIPSPGPFECGPDPTPDAMGCESPPEC